MRLSTGDRLGPYEIRVLIGKGGMGEVYRAHDPRLNRDVAIKVSGEKFSERFTREARTIASLNHTNICHLYDVGPDYLVMEYVEGEDLKGPMEFADALPILEQLIDGIEAAHEKNVIHRDLKPANVKITPEGIVKILDFGLAKAMEPPPSGSDPENSPTLTMGGTQAGTILGTAAYMSPEQAKGKAADKRADIWSFAVVLHEVLTGKKLFPGETVVEILGGVLNKEPDLSAAPERVRKLLGWCLEKDRKHRLASISDARRLLREGGTEGPAQADSLPHKAPVLPWVVAGVATLALAVTALALWPKAPELKPLVRLDLELNPPPTANLSRGPTVVISPDGSRLVWAAENKLFTRRLDETESREITGTETGYAPFFSPDGQWIGFTTAGQLKKASVDGGTIVSLAPSTGNPSGASWGDDGNILYNPQPIGNLYRVSAAGGKEELAFPRELRDSYQLWPQVLPGSKAVLFASGANTNALGISGVAHTEHSRKSLVPPNANNPRYVASPDGLGFLLYMSGTSLLATRFDAGRLEVQGEPRPVLDRVLVGFAAQGPVQFDLSRSGTAVFRRGEIAGGSERLFWVDGSGKKTPLLAKSVVRPRFSPDANRIALEINQDIWIYEWRRDTSIRLTTDQGQGPVWTPDGRAIFYRGNGGIFWTRSDGASQPQLLLPTQSNIFPWSVSPDGKHLGYMEVIDGQWHLFTVPVEINGSTVKAGKPEVFLKTAADERYPSFSPDGRWLAYTSNQSGTYQIHVRPFPDRGGQWQVSSNGGTHPEWGRDGKTLFFRSLEQKIMAVDYLAKGDAFLPERPRVWSEVVLTDQGMIGTYTMHPDSKRMAAVLPAELTDGAKPDTHVTILFNFLDELKRKVR